MKKLLVFASLCVLSTFCVQFAAAQTTEAGALPQPQAQPLTRGDTPQYQKFVDEMKAYKESLKQVHALIEKYQTASPEERDKITAEFTPLYEKLASQRKTLVPSALEAYKSVEGQNDEIRAFLCSMLEWSTTNWENYEVAYEIAKVVFDYPLPSIDKSDVLYAYAAFAAFCTMNLDDAKKWRDVAIEKKALAKVDPRDEMHISSFLTRVLPQYEEAWNKEKAIREAEAKDNLPRVLIRTTKGDITVELFKNEAPTAVGNFLELVSKGFYTDVPFHRVLPYFMAQGGDPTGTGAGGPGYCIPCECTKANARDHFRGSLSMAHAGRDTGGSQFFLTFVPTYFLNGQHTVFGRVVEGMDVLSDIQRIDPEKESEVAPDKIIEAKILRGELYEFKKLPERRR